MRPGRQSAVKAVNLNQLPANQRKDLDATIGTKHAKLVINSEKTSGKAVVKEGGDIVITSIPAAKTVAKEGSKIGKKIKKIF